jgi:hypothetical protein
MARLEFDQLCTGQLAQGTDCVIDHNPPQPAPERRLAAKLADSAKSGDERFLGYLLGQFPAIAHPHRDREGRRLEAPVDTLQGASITPPCAGERQLIDRDIESVVSHRPQ